MDRILYTIVSLNKDLASEINPRGMDVIHFATFCKQQAERERAGNPLRHIEKTVIDTVEIRKDIKEKLSKVELLLIDFKLDPNQSATR